jgi:membrane protease YdiL (CAAX protease family)
VILLCTVAAPVMQLLVAPLLGDRSPWFGLALTELFLLWLALLAVRRRGWLTEDLFLLNAVPAAALVAAPLAAFGAALLASALDAAVGGGLRALDLGPPAGLGRALLEVQLITDLPSALTVVVTVVLLPAVCEEAFFRGFVFTGLRYHRGPRAAVAGSALLFALAHFNPWQLPALLLLGLFLGWLVHHTHSLYPAMAAHAVNNGLSVLAVNVRAHSGADPLGALQAPHPALLGLAAAALVAGILWLRQQQPLMPILSPWAPPAPGDARPVSGGAADSRWH